MNSDQRKVQTPDVPPPKSTKEVQSFLGRLNYLSMFSPATADVCEALQKLTSVKEDWTWQRMYQEVYGTAKKLVKKDACMKF